MKRTLATLLAMTLLIGAVGLPSAMASSVTGTGQSRTVSLYDPYVYTNATVVVPTVIDNSTNISFSFLLTDESGVGGVDYTFNITVYDNNATWWNGTVDTTSVADDNVTS